LRRWNSVRTDRVAKATLTATHRIPPCTRRARDGENSSKCRIDLLRASTGMCECRARRERGPARICGVGFWLGPIAYYAVRSRPLAKIRLAAAPLATARNCSAAACGAWAQGCTGRRSGHAG
jgi:hypothetical protein